MSCATSSWSSARSWPEALSAQNVAPAPRYCLDVRMTTLTRGADRLLELHAAELPQKDELCGCFWATLALRLHGEGPVEQDDAALIAGSVITSHGSVGVLPYGHPGRADFIAELPVTDDDEASGTSAHGVARAIDELAGGRLAALPVTGLDARGLRALLHAAAEGTVPVVLIANVQTGAFWGSHATAAQLAAYLERGDLDAGPRAGLVGRPLRRPRGPERGARGRARDGRRHVSGARPRGRAPAAGRAGRGRARGPRRARGRGAGRRAQGRRGGRRPPRAVGQRQSAAGRASASQSSPR